MDRQLLERTLVDLGQPAFRGGQVWEWAARGAGSYGEMTNLPVGLRDELERRVPLSSLTLEREALASDGTEKALFATADGRPLETVLMRYRGNGAKDSASGPNRTGSAKDSASGPNRTGSAKDSASGPNRTGGRRSLCLSSQSGCPLTCTFCATGSMKFGRNLTASEILDQALHFRRKEEVDHAVFMGMGEPMLNIDAVLAACERLPDLGIHPSSTTISTVGWIPGIERLSAHDGPTIRLALSLHAPEDALRSELMPVNERFPLADVLDACRRWHEARRRKVYIEYLMLAGVNDRVEQAAALARLLVPRTAFKVNLIPYNPTNSDSARGAEPGRRSGEHRTRPFTGSGREAIAAFRDALSERGVPTTVRLTRGRDIDAACGQLAARG